MAATTMGLVYRCPICGAEVTVLAAKMGRFGPRCCGKNMMLTPRRLVMYFCPHCGAEIAVVCAGEGDLRPRCCGQDMLLKAA